MRPRTLRHPGARPGHSPGSPPLRGGVGGGGAAISHARGLWRPQHPHPGPPLKGEGTQTASAPPDRPFLRPDARNPLPTHGVIPAQAGIHSSLDRPPEKPIHPHRHCPARPGNPPVFRTKSRVVTTFRWERPTGQGPRFQPQHPLRPGQFCGIRRKRRIQQRYYRRMPAAGPRRTHATDENRAPGTALAPLPLEGRGWGGGCCDFPCSGFVEAAAPPPWPSPQGGGNADCKCAARATILEARRTEPTPHPRSHSRAGGNPFFPRQAPRKIHPSPPSLPGSSGQSTCLTARSWTTRTSRVVTTFRYLFHQNSTGSIHGV
ncbi:hypothetical protein SAMN02745223_00152 [Devosia limi DSM 17137]|uniref:Uncharacterized protein n=1 Tax=Devosia limi DSM 17137 TaxID=1121477 RepID=A0A1M4STV8_9HYPH|nr:hypothetical protein SAMN02745223_00152 [Devosia limi DSM 17137]